MRSSLGILLISTLVCTNYLILNVSAAAVMSIDMGTEWMKVN
jgi:stringent starvation protein B